MVEAHRYIRSVEWKVLARRLIVRLPNAPPSLSLLLAARRRIAALAQGP